MPRYRNRFRKGNGVFEQSRHRFAIRVSELRDLFLEPVRSQGLIFDSMERDQSLSKTDMLHAVRQREVDRREIAAQCLLILLDGGEPVPEKRSEIGLHVG